WARRRPAQAALLAVSAVLVLTLLTAALVHSAQLERYNAGLQAAAKREHRQAEEARRQQALAQERERAARVQSYVTGFGLAGKLWEEGQRGLLGERLNQLRPGPGEEDLRGFEWHYLWRQGRSLRQLRGHQEGIHAVAFSPDGWLCASGSGDRSVKV